jgi:Cu/Ag efflux protein CusF
LPESLQSDLRAGLLKVLAFVFAATLSASCAQRPQAGAPARPAPQASASPIPWATIEAPARAGVASGTPQPRQPVRRFPGQGIVRLVNLEEGWVEIDHEEIAGFMPAMQMEWTVRNRSLLKSVSVGDRVDFTLEDDNGNEVVTDLKKAP